MAYNQQWNFVIQRQLARDLVLDLAYVGSHGLNLPAASLNLNQLPPEYLDFARAHYAEYANVNGAAATSPAGFFSAQVTNPFANLITHPNSNLRSATVTRAQLLSPFPQYAAVTDYRPHVGSLNYHGLQIHLQKRFGRGIGGTASYVWSKAIDTGGPGNNSGQGTSVENIYNIAQDRSISRFDFREALSEAPFGRCPSSAVPKRR